MIGTIRMISRFLFCSRSLHIYVGVSILIRWHRYIYGFVSIVLSVFWMCGLRGRSCGAYLSDQGIYLLPWDYVFHKFTSCSIFLLCSCVPFLWMRWAVLFIRGICNTDHQISYRLLLTAHCCFPQAQPSIDMDQWARYIGAERASFLYENSHVWGARLGSVDGGRGKGCECGDGGRGTGDK